MELATVIVDAVKLSDDAHRANNAGHPEEAKESLAKLWWVLDDSSNLWHKDTKQETEPAPETPSLEPKPNGEV